MQHMNMHSSKELATIIDTGSTNTPGFTFTIYTDGSGSIRYEQRPGRNWFRTSTDRDFAAGELDNSSLAELLQQIDDVSTIPDHACPKSASFGTVRRILYQGKQSGDLTCISSQDLPVFYALKQCVNTLLTQTKETPSSS
uniref:Uncharacterized protein n=1 Tax=Thermosporothrix sp. COM3 TaxID=2490863 RepID=A0A455SU24_9CHLR|nr:hypothetical protein KTC_58770 [Thermosporothrix sp. COM3]